MSRSVSSIGIIARHFLFPGVDIFNGCHDATSETSPDIKRSRLPIVLHNRLSHSSSVVVTYDWRMFLPRAWWTTMKPMLSDSQPRCRA